MSVLLLVLACLFPRTFNYSNTRGDGRPLVVAGSVDTAGAKARAKWQTQTLEIAPWVNLRGPARPDVPFLLRRFNPQTRILGYIACDGMENWLWPGLQLQSWDQSFWADYWLTLKRFDAWLYTPAGALHPYANVNWSNRAFADSMAVQLAKVSATGVFSGFFFDSFAGAAAWTGQGSSTPIDLARAGFANGVAFDSARAVNMGRLIETVRQAGGPCFLIAVNGTTPDSVFARWHPDAELAEGFGSNSYWLPAGTFDKALAFVQHGRAPMRLLKSETWAPAYSTEWNRLARYTLGTACLGDAYAWTGADRNQLGEKVGWPDEASVTSWPYCRSDSTGTGVGWLGQPGSVTKLSTGVYLRWFSGGAVLVNPTSSAVTVNLGLTMRRILGIRDPVVNTGQDGWLQRVGPQDALFLCRPAPTSRRSE